MNKDFYKKIAVLSIIFVPLTLTFSRFIFPKFYISFAITILGLIYLLYPIRNKWFIIRKKNISIALLLIGCFLIQLVDNHALKNGDYQYTIYFFSFVVAFFILIKTRNWIKFVLSFSQILAVFYSFLTVFFYFNEELYRQYVLWAYPSKSSMIFMNYERGYMSGVFDNYSACGIWMTLSIGLSFTHYLKSRKTSGKIFYLMCTILSVVGLLLTAKRGVTLYTACALVLVYFIWNLDKPIPGVIKLLGAVLISITIFQMLITYIPDLANVFDRFNEVLGGNDLAMSGRIIMRRKAMELFKAHPIFGIGWRGFLYGRYFKDGDVHNTFAQLLCETGIVGFTFFCSLVVMSLLKTVDILRKLIIKGYKNFDASSQLAFSLFIQIVFLMYFISGNPLYDLSLLCPYFIGIWILGVYQEKYFIGEFT